MIALLRILLDCLCLPIFEYLNEVAVIRDRTLGWGRRVGREVRKKGGGRVRKKDCRRMLGGFWRVIGRGVCRFCGWICS